MRYLVVARHGVGRPLEIIGQTKSIAEGKRMLRLARANGFTDATLYRRVDV